MLNINFLNCSEALQCFIEYQAKTDSRTKFVFLLIVISATGIVLNTLCLILFNKGCDMKKKIFQSLNLLSLNSLLMNLRELLIIMCYLFMNTELYRLNGLEMYGSPYFTWIYVFINLPLWTTLYTYAGLLNIYITYERIQIVMNTFGFIRRTSVYKASLILVIAAIIINIPINLGRDVKNIYLKINSNETTNLTFYGTSTYTNDTIFLVTLLLANGFRDFILVMIDMVLNIYLAVKLKTFFKKKKAIKNRSNARADEVTKFKLSRTEIKNTITTCVLSLISIVQHLVTFMVFITYLASTDTNFIWALTLISGSTTQVKHASNFLIFSIFNNKFRGAIQNLFSN